MQASKFRLHTPWARHVVIVTNGGDREQREEPRGSVKAMLEGMWNWKLSDVKSEDETRTECCMLHKSFFGARVRSTNLTLSLHGVG